MGYKHGKSKKPAKAKDSPKHEKSTSVDKLAEVKNTLVNLFKPLNTDEQFGEAVDSFSSDVLEQEIVVKSEEVKLQSCDQCGNVYETGESFNIHKEFCKIME